MLLQTFGHILLIEQLWVLKFMSWTNEYNIILLCISHLDTIMKNVSHWIWIELDDSSLWHWIAPLFFHLNFPYVFFNRGYFYILGISPTTEPNRAQFCSMNDKCAKKGNIWNNLWVVIRMTKMMVQMNYG